MKTSGQQQTAATDALVSLQRQQRTSVCESSCKYLVALETLSAACSREAKQNDDVLVLNPADKRLRKQPNTLFMIICISTHISGTIYCTSDEYLIYFCHLMRHVGRRTRFKYMHNILFSYSVWWSYLAALYSTLCCCDASVSTCGINKTSPNSLQLIF